MYRRVRETTGSGKFFGEHLGLGRQAAGARPIAFAAGGARVVDELFNFCGQIRLSGVEFFALGISQIFLSDCAGWRSFAAAPPNFPPPTIAAR